MHNVESNARGSERTLQFAWMGDSKWFLSKINYSQEKNRPKVGCSYCWRSITKINGLRVIFGELMLRIVVTSINITFKIPWNSNWINSSFCKISKLIFYVETDLSSNVPIVTSILVECVIICSIYCQQLQNWSFSFSWKFWHWHKLPIQTNILETLRSYLDISI